jgi:predicted amino acid-binding ACT domain protein
MNKIKKRLDKAAKEMSLNITLQDENIFKAMHRI